ncbi:MAG: phytoene desaturase family protein, partial [Ralstonia sp.]
PVIDGYIRAARSFLSFDLLGMPMASPWQMLRWMPKVPLLPRWGKVTLEQFAERFQNPLLRQAFPTLQYDFPGIPMLIHLNFLAGCHSHILGWPSGGSLAFARTVAERCESLGGQIHYGSPVEKILVENDRAVGVRLGDGTEHRADVIVSAADGHATIFEMLDGQYTDARIRAYYDAAPDGNEMNFCVALGVARDMRDEPHALTLFLEQPVELLGPPHGRLSVEIYNWDPALAPAGKTPIKVLLKATYSQWKALSADRARYDEEKARVAETVIDVLAARFPGLRQQIEVVDVSTPLTIERYTGNYHGLQAWGVPDGGMGTMLRGFTRTLPGLAGFHMAGQWAEAMIGISTAAISGRNAVRRICRQDGRQFRTGGTDE